MPKTREEILSSNSAGILMPLFSMRGESDWGVGDFYTFEEWIEYFSLMGNSIVQILPVNEMSPSTNCPYNSISGFAIDPVYIAINKVRDITDSDKAQTFMQGIAPLIEMWRSTSKIFYTRIRDAKLKALWHGYDYFMNHEAATGSERALRFKQFIKDNDDVWLHSYAVFRAAKDLFTWKHWTDWPDGLRDHEPEAVAQFAATYNVQVTFYKYVQWTIDEQIASVKAKADRHDVNIYGDIPFSLNIDSADVWAEREFFDLKSEVGAPPDQFSTEGQHWGLVAYNWTHMQAEGFSFWRRKIERICKLYSMFRLDHLVGFFRTYIFNDIDPKGHYDVTDEGEQYNRGKNFLLMTKDASGTALAAGEDLGVIPDYMRGCMAELNIPGYKVVRWERDYGYYREPRTYPKVSVAAISTHDTEPLKLWWETMDRAERSNIWEMFSAQKTDGTVPFTDFTQEVILRRVLDAGSAVVIFSLQDIIGTTDRVNTPGTVSADNWSYRIDCTVKEMDFKYGKQLDIYRRLLEETGRKK
ncbi:4-alpha-glucanotransferase [Parelusimicrobium proximum]|uniref:4-alpha-glucanotransferase n=1 Tax=Parelusimicrobium proximum TaxID=3228953 RepID=UPI003D175EF0